MWLQFTSHAQSGAVALKIGVGGINAITGKPWTGGLRANGEQDYVVLPRQPWLDGFCTEAGVVRQFIAMPLGSGYTAEGQLTGAEKESGLRFEAYALHDTALEVLLPGEADAHWLAPPTGAASAHALRTPEELGLADGAVIRVRSSRKGHLPPGVSLCDTLPHIATIGPDGVATLSFEMLNVTWVGPCLS